MARRWPSNDAVPPTFEKRMLAVLREELRPDPLEALARSIWKAAVSSLGVMAVSVVVCWYLDSGIDGRGLSGEEIETALWESVDSREETW